MTILEFMVDYPDNAACKAHFKEQREEEGVQCKKCGSTSHYWLKTNGNVKDVHFVQHLKVVA